MKKAWLALVFGSAIFLAACGGGDNDTTTEPETNTDTTPTEQTNTTDEDATNDGETDGTGDATTDDGTTNDGTTNDGAADDVSLEKGQEIVQKNCINCHGGNLEGMGTFPALNDVGSRLSQEEILNVILNGQGGMPPGIVKGEDAEAAAAYLASLK